jgi:hypothetical protein
MHMVYTRDWIIPEQLAFLHGLKSCRVAGSFAAGCPRPDSALDIQLCERDIKAYKAFLREKRITWTSKYRGHVVADGIEVFMGFTGQNDQVPEVEINGLRFKTA